MMTAAQTRFFWCVWASVAHAHQWRGSGEALAATRQVCFVSPQLDPVYQRVWLTAESLAAEEHRALAADDLRHACHIVATGSQVSSKALTNAELDRVLDLFRLLAAPHILKHVIAWQDAEAGERRRLLHHIQQFPVGYYEAITRGKFKGEIDLDRLTLQQLRQLSLTLRNRRPASRLAPCVPQAQKLDPELCTF